MISIYTVPFAISLTCSLHSYEMVNMLCIILSRYQHVHLCSSCVSVTSIRRITTDFRLGFGSFVDKTILPYVLTDLNKYVLSAVAVVVVVVAVEVVEVVVAVVVVVVDANRG